MNISGINVYGFRPAITRGMRNPKNSWDRSDTTFEDGRVDSDIICPERPVIGPNDMKLALKLINCNPDTMVACATETRWQLSQLLEKVYD